VPDNWRTYFDNLQHVPAVDGSDSRDVAHAPVVESFAQRAKANAFALKASEADLAVARKQVHVQSLIAAYRFLGSRWADLDPLKRTERPKIPELETAFYDLTESDLDITFSAANTYFGKAENMTCARSCRPCVKPTAAPSAPSSCIAPTPPKSAGGRSGWNRPAASPPSMAEQKKHILDRLTAPRGWSATCTPSMSARSASRSKAAKASSPAWTRWCSVPASMACRNW
jgi:2-oxoglutarate dehydrogenase E1 component